MILVIGAMGRIGTATVAALRARGVATRALVPHRRQVPWLLDSGAELVEDDLMGSDGTDPEVLDRLLEGVQGVVLIARPAAEQVDLERLLVDACAERGVRRMVKWSVAGAAENAPADAARWHWRSERHLLRTAAEPCVARSGRLMQDLLYQTPLMLAHHMTVGCQGNGQTADVDARDVGGVLASLAVAAEPPSAPLLVTGPEAFTQQEIATMLGTALGLDIRHVTCTPPELAQLLLAAGVGQWQLEDLVAYEAAVAAGSWNVVTDVVPTWTGRAARPFADFAHDVATSLQYHHFDPPAHGAVQGASRRATVLAN